MEWIKKCSAGVAVLAVLGFAGVTAGCEEANDAASATGDAVEQAADDTAAGAKSVYGEVVETAENVAEDMQQAGQDAVDAVKDAAE